MMNEGCRRRSSLSSVPSSAFPSARIRVMLCANKQSFAVGESHVISKPLFNPTLWIIMPRGSYDKDEGGGDEPQPVELVETYGASAHIKKMTKNSVLTIQTLGRFSNEIHHHRSVH